METGQNTASTAVIVTFHPSIKGLHSLVGRSDKKKETVLPVSSVFRYRERLHQLLEEERGQRRKSWQLGLSALEQQQHRLLEAQQSATQALKETDTCTFIQRYFNYINT